MKYIDYQEVIKAGANLAELKAYLEANPDIELINYSQPQPPSPSISTNQMQTKVPDMVNSIPDTTNIQTTEGFQYGHPAVDKAPVDPNQNVPMANSIGGVPFSGTVTDPTGQYYEGFGNYYGAIGASPEELAQMTPEEKARMAIVAKEIMDKNLSNEQANEELARAFPGKNINFNAHLQNPVASDPQGIATGSAQLTMGSTGQSSGKHTHQQFIDVNGQPMDYEQAMEIIRSRQYR